MNQPGSPKFAIPQSVADIAMKYGKNVSRGIKEMERRLQALGVGK
jgi:hypothetical protein